MTKLKNNQNLVTMDVRPTIASGQDPFHIIMQAVKGLKREETLQIINSFEPIPLIKKLQSQGFESWTERPIEGQVHTFFKMDKSSVSKVEANKGERKANVNFDEELAYFGDNIRVIDVRHLEMPEPMVTILKEIETLKVGEALYVDHNKIPQFLLPELEVRNFNILYKEVDSNNTKLLIYKSKN